MLLGAEFKNFLSFNHVADDKPVSFSLVPGRVHGKKEHVFENGKFKTLKYTSVFGANAAGKSNFVKALRFIQLAVRGRLSRRNIGSYFKLESGNSEKESLFEIRILLHGVVYCYGFRVLLKDSCFLQEWLMEQPNPKVSREIFTRDTVKEYCSFYGRFKNGELNKKLKIYSDDVSSDSSVLLLTILNKNKDRLYNEYPEIQVIRNVYRWITQNLVIGLGDMPVSDYEYFVKEDNIKDINKVLNHFATGIQKFEIVEVPEERVLDDMPRNLRKMLIDRLESNRRKIDINEVAESGVVIRAGKDLFIISLAGDSNKIVCKTIKFIHEKQGVLFDFWEESDGTIRLLGLLDILLADSNRTFVIDEFEARLHPNLTYEFIRMFLERAKERSTQLIITTHETGLMDLNLVRRDEIQLMQKDENGGSIIVPLETKRVRFDKSVGRSYLVGEYGGVPEFKKIQQKEGEKYAT